MDIVEVEAVSSSFKASPRLLFADSDTERSGQLVEAVACKTNRLIGRQALTVTTELLRAVDEGGLHPQVGYRAKFPRMGGNQQHP